MNANTVIGSLLFYGGVGAFLALRCDFLQFVQKGFLVFMQSYANYLLDSYLVREPDKDVSLLIWV